MLRRPRGQPSGCSTSNASITSEGGPRFALVYAGALLTLFAAGIGLGALRERTGSVAGPFMAHWLAVALVRLAIWARA